MSSTLVEAILRLSQWTCPDVSQLKALSLTPGLPPKTTSIYSSLTLGRLLIQSCTISSSLHQRTGSFGNKMSKLTYFPQPTLNESLITLNLVGLSLTKCAARTISSLHSSICLLRNLKPLYSNQMARSALSLLSIGQLSKSKMDPGFSTSSMPLPESLCPL